MINHTARGILIALVLVLSAYTIVNNVDALATRAVQCEAAK